VDNVLSVMVSGLEDELKARLQGNKVYSSNNLSPSAPDDTVGSAMLPGKSPTAITATLTPRRSSRLSLRQAGKWMFTEGRRN
jgi:hypothetical protein